MKLSDKPTDSEPQAALRERLLPGEFTHNVIVGAGMMQRVPALVLLLLCLAPMLGVGMLYAEGGWAAGVLVAAVLTDALLLVLLPRLGVSFGPVQGPLAVFTLGRLLLAAPLALLPAGWDLAGLVALQSTLSLCSLWGHLVAPFRVTVTTVRAPILRQVPDRPVRLALITDLHVERLTRREGRVLAILEALEPDLVLFGGDLLNLSYVRDARALADARSFMATVLQRHELRVVLGNPTVEVRPVVRPFWEDLGVRPLDGAAEGFCLHGARLWLYGLSATLSSTHDVEGLAALVTEHPPPADAATVLLYHLPDLAGRTPGVDLYLAGHTHGGQIRLPLLGPIFTASSAARGLAMGTHRVGETLLHTSRGLGMEGSGAPRMRFLCPPEITLVELVERS